jgi:hypothetical protein
MKRSLLILAALSLLVAVACTGRRGGGGDDDSAVDDDDAVDNDDAVDACAAAVPCTGDYIVENSSGMDAAAPCESISGNLWIGPPKEGGDQDWITSINLPCLASVGGHLGIYDNPFLTDISGQSNLTSVGGDLWISDNLVLTNISGLSSLTSVGGYLYFRDNPLLCQSLVDAFVAACSCGTEGDIANNDDDC